MFPLLSILAIYAVPAPLKEIQKRFLTVTMFEAQFDQTVDQKLFKDQKETASGRLNFKKPNFMTWTYESPEKRTISFLNGELIIEEAGHKERIKSTGPLTLEQSFSFLWGRPDEKAFKILPMNQSQFSVEPRVIEDAPFKRIEVSVKNGLVHEVLVHTNLDAINRIQFSRWTLK